MGILQDIANLTPQGLVADLGGKVIDTVAGFFPNPEEKAKAAEALALAQARGQFQEEQDRFSLMLEQIKADAAEAASTNWFVAGWRPWVGWVCGMGLAYQFLFLPMGNGIAALFGYATILRGLDTSTLQTCLFAMLGMGGLRTAEKVKGAARS